MENQADLTAALRSLGVKGSEGYLDLLGLIQPTAQMLDLAAMGPAVLPPMSAFGARNGIPGAGNHSTITLRSLSKGGSFIAFSGFSTSSVQQLFANILDTAPALVGPLPLTNVRIAHQPSNAVGEVGHTVGPLWAHNESPLLPILSGTWYVSSGRALVIQGSANLTLMASFVVQDVPVPPPADALTAALP